MKTLNWLIILASFLPVVSCSEDEKTFAYDQSDFYGEWELSNISPDDFQACNDNPPKLVISKDDILMTGIDENTGCATANSSSLNYSFNGSSFTIPSFSSNGDFIITAKELNKFTWERKLGNTTQSFTYIRDN